MTGPKPRRKRPTLSNQNRALRARIHELRRELKAVRQQHWDLVKEHVELICKVKCMSEDSVPRDPLLSQQTAMIAQVMQVAIRAARESGFLHPFAGMKALLTLAAMECDGTDFGREEFLIAADWRFAAARKFIEFHQPGNTPQLTQFVRGEA